MGAPQQTLFSSVATAGSSPFTFIGSVSVGAAAGGDDITSGPLDTTGAKLLVVILESYNSSTEPVITDNASNTYVTTLTARDSAQARIHIVYKILPTTNAAHTFTSTGTDSFSSFTVLAFGGPSAVTVDVQNGHASGSGTTEQPGSITPSVDNCVLITAMCIDVLQIAAPTINLSFNQNGFVNVAAGAHFGEVAAYQIQTTATARNPTWTLDITSTCSSAIVSFKPE